MLATEAHKAPEQSIDVEEAASMTPKSGISQERPALGWKNLLNLAAFVVNIVTTFFSGTGIFGATFGELSGKYRTLVAPASWAFSIWGPIFIWEFVFVVAQFFPRFRQSKTVLLISPWWWASCAFQSAWTLAFPQDWITVSVVLMLCILVSLFGISWSTDGQQLSTAEYFLVRAPFSLHLGWIIAASAVNVNLLADALKASQETLLALFVLSSAVVLAIVTAFTFAVKSPDPIIGLVSAWAFAAIYSELNDPVKLNDPSRFNPMTWDMVTLRGLQAAALVICMLSAVMAVVAEALKIRSSSCCRDSEVADKVEDKE